MMTKNVTERTRHPMGLECVSGRARLAVPVADILEVVEYQVGGPPPLASRFVGGLGILNGKVVASISIDSLSKRAGPGMITQGILLQGASPDAPAWAIEVSEVRSFVHVTPDPVPAGAAAKSKPDFISFRRTLDGRTVGWVDVPRLLQALGVPRRSSNRGTFKEAS